MKNIADNKELMAWLAYNTISGGYVFYHSFQDETITKMDITEIIALSPKYSSQIIISHYRKVNGEARMLLLKSVMNDKELFRNVLLRAGLSINELKIVIPKVVNEWPDLMTILLKQFNNIDIIKKLKSIRLDKDTEDIFMSHVLLNKISQ